MTYDGRIRGDARALPLANESVQCCVTSPPYWGLRRYDVEGPQIGSEKTPQQWLTEMVTVFREVRRVLKNDGVCWVNIGDSYASNGGGGFQGSTSQRQGRKNAIAQTRLSSQTPPPGFKPKNLCLMPQRLAIALQDDGWYIRAEIIWAKGNCMPESVSDRVTRAHEQIWMITKSERYYYDADAIKEKASPDSHARYARGRSQTHKYADGGPGNQTIARTFKGMNKVYGWASGSGNHSTLDHNSGPRANGVHPKSSPSGSGVRANDSYSAAIIDTVDFRNKRSVWHVNSKGYPEAHYATFPPKLVEPCILAGSRPGDFVLDPFAGSGTVAMVAESLGRRWVSVDLGYQDLQKKRLMGVQKILI